MHQGDPHGAGDAFTEGMRILALVIVVAIIYVLYGRNGEKQSPQNRVAEAQQEAALVQPTPTSAAPAAPSGSLRAPMDRTRQVLDLVKKRNGE
jgi:hypothetical protein